MWRPLERGSTGKISSEFGIESSVFDIVMQCVTDLFVYLTFTALFTPTKLCNKYLYFMFLSKTVMLLFIRYYSYRSDINIIVSARD